MPRFKLTDKSHQIIYYVKEVVAKDEDEALDKAHEGEWDEVERDFDYNDITAEEIDA